MTVATAITPSWATITSRRRIWINRLESALQKGLRARSPFDHVVGLRASCKAVQGEPVDQKGWVDGCDNMRRALNHPNLGMAVLNDIGEAEDIHPRNKRDVGIRLSLWALAKDYGFTDTVYGDPLCRSRFIEGNKVTISIDSVGEGQMTARKHLLEPAQTRVGSPAEISNLRLRSSLEMGASLGRREI